MGGLLANGSSRQIDKLSNSQWREDGSDRLPRDTAACGGKVQMQD